MSNDGPRLTRIYTRAGDGGSTRLVGGQSLRKSDPRIASYGTVDELSSVLGVARAHNAERADGAEGRELLDQRMRGVQNDLFHVGAELATLPEDVWEGMHRVGTRELGQLEAQIDEMNDELGPLEEFILPGGGLVGATLHLARTVCRRAERDVVALMDQEGADHASALKYLNRLSDHLFVLARWAARRTGHSEEFWQK